MTAVTDALIGIRSGLPDITEDLSLHPSVIDVDFEHNAINVVFSDEESSHGFDWPRISIDAMWTVFGDMCAKYEVKPKNIISDYDHRCITLVL